MKTILFIWCLFFLFMSKTTISQQYNKLVIENAQWRVLNDDDNTPWPDAMNGWLLRGDTIINDVQYKKLHTRAFEDPSSNAIISQRLYGFLREDTLNKIIYAYGDQSMGCDSINEEFILFDFSYEIGDTSQLCTLNENLGYCTLIDTYYENIFGAERKIFQFCGGSIEFIEGIGHFQGLLESPVVNISGGWTTSLYDYCVGTDEECNVVYVNLNEYTQSNDYKVYPNPCKGIFYLENDSEIIDALAITINDLYGRKVNFSVKVINDHTVQIHLFSPGIYVLHPGNSEKSSSSHKILNIY